MRNGRPKAALRPHAVRSASATSVSGPKLPRRGHREVAKVPNPTPPSPSDTSEKCLDLLTLSAMLAGFELEAQPNMALARTGMALARRGVAAVRHAATFFS